MQAINNSNDLNIIIEEFKAFMEKIKRLLK